MKGRRWQVTIDDISRDQKLSYEIKTVDIDLVFGAGDCLKFFSAISKYLSVLIIVTNMESRFPAMSLMVGKRGLQGKYGMTDSSPVGPLTRDKFDEIWDLKGDGIFFDISIRREDTPTNVLDHSM
ncbi:hypothetical protein AVEN_233829-1 [Araneus ventricosus]|uniref:Uncharacterized protein n=1 Tax=Araneus ventricosus TaxID=182803 RepID=A0A4Y2H547_ARAVE|nr:hypothetical protein AVEN_233829-1 [Araneus ventricosus]